MATVMFAATAGIGERLRSEQLTGTLEALLTQPLTPLEVCIGLTGFPYLFALARSLLYLAVAGAWMELDIVEASWLGGAVMLACTGLGFVSLGVLAASVVLVLKRGDVFASTAVFALTFVSGAVFPISALPGWLEAVGKVVPFRFAFDGLRAAFFHGASWQFDALVLTATGIATLPVAIATFTLALRYARQAGSLGQY